MNLEQLTAMSDAELNELSAVKVMGWEKKLYGFVWVNEHGGESIRTIEDTSFGTGWNPCSDMNDAMEMFEVMVSTSFYDDATITYPYCIVAGYDVDEGWTIKVEDDSLPRAITVACILSKEDIEE